MSVHDFAELTWPEVEGLDAGRTVAILPIGAIEAHGPHLPLSTDGIIAVAMARRGAEELAERGWTVLLLPALPYTPARFASGFAGTLSVRRETLIALVTDLSLALAGGGFQLLALANAHLDPGHLGALDEARRSARAAGGLPVCCPDLTSRRWASRLTEEFKSGACHAGRFEGSIVLAARPELVRDSTRARLPPNPVSLSRAIREGKTSFEEAGGPEAYFGDPAAATAEEGRRTIETLGAILAEAVLEALGD